MALAPVGFATPFRLPVSSPNCTKHAEDVKEPENLSLESSPYKWRMVIAYDGTKFAGWQYQESPPTIQCLVEKALTCITKLDRKQLCLVGSRELMLAFMHGVRLHTLLHLFSMEVWRVSMLL
ncbi:hypothetical protein HPP92_001699 [Vanilla planifolia]|uniref:tRNA pseudouridine synthase n=1 Tax=Vanilla planifolia TaxID=51239 RepID=A0A835SCF2_VANPL|nr:hypothetical protein HPP92_001699 [Vanilla planifolia]